MTIKVGDRLPDSTFMTMGSDGAPKPAKTAEVFGGKRVALFAVPGAYTPTCHKQHMAGFVQNYDELKTKKNFGKIAPSPPPSRKAIEIAERVWSPGRK